MIARSICFCIFILLSDFTYSQQPPNIVLIMADDLGYEALSLYGNDFNESPNLQEMASKGMLFENSHSTPLCTPSRIQLMTGKYNFRNYVGFGILDSNEKTFGHLLQEAGYETCVVGKWQLYGYERQWELAGGRKGSFPEEAGFDDYCLWQIEQVGSRYKDPLIHTKRTGLKTYLGKYGPDLFADYAEEFMTKHAAGPFFLYYPMVLTHAPFEPTPDLPEFEGYSPDQNLNEPKYFPAMVRYMDSIIGRLIRKCEELDIAGNTLFIFMGDNGTDRKVISRVNGHEIQGNKGRTTNFSTHVPMIAYWPGRIKENSIYSGLIDFTDFVPTLMDVAGVNISGKLMNLDGISFYPVLTGNLSPKNRREWVFCHYDPNWGGREKSRFIYNLDWKLYDSGEIYNLKEDIHETNPISFEDLNRQEKTVVKKFRKIMNTMY